jgi:hypothetical protein
MREGADISDVQHLLQPRVAAETNDTASSAKTILNGQEAHVSVAFHACRQETKMPRPERAPMWYRHWGLNE